MRPEKYRTKQETLPLITLYGIKNCDTVKKARRWLDHHSIDYQYHDFRENGLDAAVVEQWLGEMGWEKLLNKRSTSWKQLDEKTRETMDDSSASGAVLANPTLIKRRYWIPGKLASPVFRRAVTRQYSINTPSNTILKESIL